MKGVKNVKGLSCCVVSIAQLKCVLLRKKLIRGLAELPPGKVGIRVKGGLIQYWICSSGFIVFLAARFIPICYNYWYPFVGCTCNYTHNLSLLLSLLVTLGTFCISLKTIRRQGVRQVNQQQILFINISYFFHYH